MALIDPANEQEQKRRSADSGDAAEDQALGTGEEDVAIISNAPGTGEMEAVFGQPNLIFVRAKKDGLRTDEEEADSDPGQGEGIRQDHRLPVHHHQADQEEAEDGEPR